MRVSGTHSAKNFKIHLVNGTSGRTTKIKQRFGLEDGFEAVALPVPETSGPYFVEVFDRPWYYMGFWRRIYRTNAVNIESDRNLAVNNHYVKQGGMLKFENNFDSKVRAIANCCSLSL